MGNKPGQDTPEPVNEDENESGTEILNKRGQQQGPPPKPGQPQQPGQPQR